MSKTQKKRTFRVTTKKHRTFINMVITYKSEDPGACTGCKKISQDARTRAIIYIDLFAVNGIEDTNERERELDKLYIKTAKEQEQGHFQERARAAICQDCLMYLINGIGISQEMFTLAIMPSFLVTTTPTIALIMVFIPGVNERVQPSLAPIPANTPLSEVVKRAYNVGFRQGGTLSFHM